MAIQRIGIVGAGAMGTGIAHVSAQSGFRVKVFDEYPEAAAKSIGTIRKLSDSAIAKGKLSREDADRTISRIEYIESIEDLADSELVIEAAFEDLDVKKKLFQKLDTIVLPEAILATNTSSMSITVLASTTQRAGKVAGMHFFNPAQVMMLVEVVRGFYTSNETIQTLKDTAAAMGKTPVEVKRDSPGFIVNRLLLPQLREAVKLLEEGVATIEDIDTAMKLGLNHPMGPFTLQDLSGVDVVCHVLEYFQREMGEQYSAPLMIKQMVAAGNWGRKTGRGWYDYTNK